MRRGHGRHALLALAMAACALGLLAPAAGASHEKGGYLDLAIGADGVLSGHLRYLHTNPAGSCPYPGAASLTGLSVSVAGPAGFTGSAPIAAPVVDCSPSTLTESATFTYDASAGGDGLYTATFSSCCRIGGIVNTGEGSTVLSAGVVRHGALAASSPILSSNVALGVSVHAPYAQNLNAADPDGGALGYQLLQGADAGGPGYDVDAPGSNLVALDGAGLMTIPMAIATGLAVPAAYAAKVRVTDSDGGYATRDVLLSTTDGHPPALGAATWLVQVVAGETATATFAASDPDTGQLVSFDAAGLPGWGALATAAGNPAAATLTLSPPAGTPAQTVGVNVDASDDDPTVALRTSGHLVIQVLATAPVVTLTSAPAAVGADPRPAFGLQPSLPGAAMRCSLDGAAWVACTDAWRPAAALADGPHELRTEVVLAGGATGATATRRFTVDTVAPAAPALLSDPASGSLQFAGEPDGSYECAMDGGIWMTCGPGVDVSGRAPGAHRIAVRQTDAAGNSGLAAVAEWTVPAASGPPSPPPGAEPSRVSTVTPAVAALDGGALVVGCRLDSGTLKSCTVRAYVTVTHGGKRKRVLLGRGTLGHRGAAGGGAAPGAGGSQSGAEGAVRVKLGRRGCLLACRAGGVRLALDVRAESRAGTVVTSRRSVRVRTPRLIAVPSDGMFRSGGVRLLPRGARAIRRIARQLAGVPRVRCTGHTDSDGAAAYNQRLGLARARATCGYLRRHGVHARMTVASMGERRPRASNRTVRGRARNRRVDISVACERRRA